MRIIISSQHLEADDVIKSISHIKDIEIRVNPKEADKEPFRTLEATVIVAIVSAAGVGLGALIGGILSVAAQAQNKKIVIQTQRGTRIEVPVDCSKEKVQDYVEMLKDLETARIEI
ncbi:MAG TPA: hypothetical protein VKB86_05680 [Pyrinomonadaceae bacterium]|nr:hypothetical protein [Pyrinomonadaceae bacterium]